MPQADAAFGFINARKPRGVTSTSFGSQVRRALGGVPLGHWGTLDPDAEGVLVLAAGHATKLLPLLGAGRKRYEFDLVLGRSTDTGDASGTVVSEARLAADWREHLPTVVASLVGIISQLPPMYSAVKVAGRPLYESARKGLEVARSPRDVQIHAFSVLGYSENGARMSVECDAGTYIRTLCEEVGTRLSVPAHMDMLVRTAAGPFALADAVPAQTLLEEARKYVIDPRSVLALPSLALDADQLKHFAHGNVVVLAGAADVDGPNAVVLVTFADRIVGTARATQIDGAVRLQPDRVFNP